MEDFIEPALIKTGDDRVLLGQFKQPPKVDCRVISEYHYQKLVKESDSLPLVSVLVLEEIRQAFADYYRSEGCECCRNEKEHDKAEEKLAEILKPDKYDDGSGYDWYKYASTER